MSPEGIRNYHHVISASNGSSGLHGSPDPSGQANELQTSVLSPVGLWAIGSATFLYA